MSEDIQEALWQIAKKVAETDSTRDGLEDIHGIPIDYFCPFCGQEQSHKDMELNVDFPHVATCIVTKARELIKQRELQPRVELKIHDASDEMAVINSVLCWKELVNKKDGE